MNRQHTIVVGYDASREAWNAVRWARAVAAPDDRILVVAVWDVPITVGHEMAIVVDPGEIEEHTRAKLDELIAAEGDDRLDAELCRGHAGRALVEAAEHADAVVVGHRGSTRMSLLIGSTASYVIHHTDRPVVVVRGDDPSPPTRVIVGVDDFGDAAPDANPSVRAVRWASRLRGVEELTVVHGWYVPVLATGVFREQAWDVEAMDEGALAVAQRVVDDAGPLPDGVVASAESARGTGTFALVERSSEADLVVVGRRGHGGFAELLLGSTSAALAAHSHCPVAIVR